MNKIIKAEIAFGVVLVFAVLVGGLVWLDSKKEEKSQKSTLPAVNQKEFQESSKKDVSQKSEKSPEQVTREYYESYINFLNKKSNADRSLDAGFVTQKIIQSFKKASDIRANPFLCAQNFPDDTSKLTVTSINKNATTAKIGVVVFTDWPRITVSLTKENGIWKINEILCKEGNKL